MAMLTRPDTYNIQDSNIALFGSDIEKRVREHAGDKEAAWEAAVQQAGLEIWRVEKFELHDWPKEKYGTFYSGDSYIVLHTYKAGENAPMAYDVHFWLGEETSQDEAGTAAYKTVELDDHLGGAPTQYREVQSHESARFLSYFPHITVLHGGVSTGFHHVSSVPELTEPRLYAITTTKSGTKSHVAIRQIRLPPPRPKGADGEEGEGEGSGGASRGADLTLSQGSVYVLDKGDKVTQFNSKGSLGQGKFKAAEFVRSLADARDGRCEVKVYDEGESGAGMFFTDELAEAEVEKETRAEEIAHPTTLYRLVKEGGSATYDKLDTLRSSLLSDGIYLLDNSGQFHHPAVYVWLGSESSAEDRRLGLHYAQQFLYHRKSQEGGTNVKVETPLIKVNEDKEPESFNQCLE